MRDLWAIKGKLRAFSRNFGMVTLIARVINLLDERRRWIFLFIETRACGLLRNLR